jgi:hypothetical protein
MSCPICAKDPLAHSFKKVGEKRGITMFYTKPSQAKRYDDTEGILAHVDNTIGQLNGKKWICIVDGDQFDAKYIAEWQTGAGLMQLFFTKYVDSLVEIKIINPTVYVRTAMKVLLALIADDKTSKITVLDDKPYSVLQFI